MVACIVGVIDLQVIVDGASIRVDGLSGRDEFITAAPADDEVVDSAHIAHIAQKCSRYIVGILKSIIIPIYAIPISIIKVQAKLIVSDTIIYKPLKIFTESKND